MLVVRHNNKERLENMDLNFSVDAKIAKNINAIACCEIEHKKTILFLVELSIGMRHRKNSSFHLSLIKV